VERGTRVQGRWAETDNSMKKKKKKKKKYAVAVNACL
jgi:hypothetical protein